jgi:beta-glucanase (GH16 family)
MANTQGHFTFTTGTLEARVYFPASSSNTIANWPAVWTDGASWPTNGESDLMEGLSGKACFHYHSPSTAAGGCAGALIGWHVLKEVVKPGVVTFYYDGVQVGQVSDGTVGKYPHYLILTNEMGGYGGLTTVPADFMIDYLRVTSP